MSTAFTIDPRTPVVVGSSEVVHRPAENFQPHSATELMNEAVQNAFDKRLSPANVGEILIPHGTWSESNPGAVIAASLGATNARCIRSELGVLQYSLLRRAMVAIQNGDIEIAIVTGGENRWSDVEIAKNSRPHYVIDERAQTEPDEILTPAEQVITQIEIERNLTTAAHQYAIIESAIRHRQKRSPEAHQLFLGEFWEGFAAVAKSAPAAWDQRGLSAAEIAQPNESNRMLASPYTKWLISQWNVDQAAALVLTSYGYAKAAGFSDDELAFPLGIAESNAVITMPERVELDAWPGARAVGAALYEKCAVAPSQISFADFYSCFPAAVQVQAREYQLEHLSAFTITGGMTFAGGPFNNYSLQGASAVASRLRSTSEPQFALSTAVSGLLTKPAAILWSSVPTATTFAAIDCTETTKHTTAVLPVDPDLSGDVTICGYTVVPDRSGELNVVAVVESNNRRSVAIAADSTLGRWFDEADRIGETITVGESGQIIGRR
ncbi:MAG: hypothetical protein RLZZ31_1527 [Actinomycetota bacterium]